MIGHPRNKLSDLRDATFVVGVVVVMLFATALRAWVLLVTDNGIDFHFNAYDRSLFTWYDWMQSDRIAPMPDYGPLHFYLLRIMFYFTGYDAIWWPRIMSLCMGVAMLVPLMRLTQRSFGKRAALWAGVAGALYPLGVRLSTVSLEVALFMFLVLMSADALSRAIDKKQGNWEAVISTAVWINLACATRFEGWFLLPVMALIMIKASWPKAVAFGALSSFFPLLWMAVNKAVTGNPLGFAAVSSAVQKIHSTATPLLDRVIGWPVIWGQTGTWAMGIAVVIGLVIALRYKRGGVAAAMGLSLFALFEVFAIRGTMALNETKYIAAVGALLLPFAGVAINEFSAASSAAIQKAGPWVAIGVIALFSISTIAKDNTRFAPPAEVKKLCAFLADQKDSGQQVLLGVRFQGYILARSGLPYQRFTLIPSNDQTGMRDPVYFWKGVKENAPCLLIHNTLPDRLDFQELVPIDGNKVKTFESQGFVFEPAFHEGYWFVLSVKAAPVEETSDETKENNS